jgi:acetyl-CoA/propionyl-CoA carboxylase biotin carboxyl carrier protein
MDGHVTSSDVPITLPVELPFDTVLIANRGEIAVRVARTLRRMGIRSVAVFTAADAGSPHVAAADAALEIGSYLSVGDVVGAATAAGAGAIHPGYGFLSENPALARACDAAGVIFVGPPAAAIEAMGDKIAAKATVAAAGVSVVPGSDGAGLTDERLAAAARDVGFPVLLKPSAGGGGKGMRLVESDADLAGAIESARREARGSFGDDTLLVERFVTNPRHVEIQVFADAHGGAVHLGERECSLQRRHQKIVEEAPSPLLTPEIRSAMGRQAVDAARACGYVGAGTVEFIVSSDRPDEFFFMEMNTRLQVEHPVTELVYGVDLVEWQVRVAGGDPLPLGQDELIAEGHAIETRIYAEDPGRGFLPTGGTIVGYHEPTGDGVRVDSGVTAGTVVGSSFDPMLAKVIAWAPDRRRAIERLDSALADTAIAGVTTNIAFLRRLLAVGDVVAGRLDTGLVERRLEELTERGGPDTAAAVVTAAILPLDGRASSGDPWSALVGWEPGGTVPVRRELDVSGVGRVELGVEHVGPGGWRVHGDAVGDGTARLDRVGHGLWRLTFHGIRHPVRTWTDGDALHVSVGGDGWAVREVVHRGDDTAGHGAAADRVVRSPMPGTLIAIHVAPGDEVTAGQPVAVVEAMKMEHQLTAPTDGVVEQVHAAVGAGVGLDEVLVTLTADEGTG